MGVAVTSRVRRGGTPGWVYYVFANGGQGRAAAYMSDLGGPVGIVEHVNDFMAGTRRKNEAHSVVHSFPLNELSPDNPEDVDEAVRLTYEALKRAAPNSPVVVVAHVDAAGGHLHTHALIVNHDAVTGNACVDDLRHWVIRRHINAVCTENGYGIPVPQATASVSPHLGETAPEAALSVEDIDSQAGARQYLRERIDAAILTDGVVTPDDVVRELADRGVHVTRKPDTGHGETWTYGAVDDQGDTLRWTRTSKKGRVSHLKIAATQTKLGAAYSPSGIADQLAEVAAYHEQEKQDHASARQTQENATAGNPAVDRTDRDTVNGPNPRSSGVSQPTGESAAEPDPRAKRRSDPEPAAGHARATAGRNSGDQDADGISPHIRQLLRRLQRDHRRKEEERERAAADAAKPGSLAAALASVNPGSADGRDSLSGKVGRSEAGHGPGHGGPSMG